MSTPGAAAVSFPPKHRVDLPSLPTSVSEARRFVREALAVYGVDEGPLAETAVLLTSELVTNAVLYATGTVGVAVDLAGDCIRVSVGDGSRSPPRPRRARPEDISGRGLGLVDALAEEWGVDPVPDDGKSVWFLLREEDPRWARRQ